MRTIKEINCCLEDLKDRVAAVRTAELTAPLIVLLGDSIVSDIYGDESLSVLLADRFPGQRPNVVSLGVSGQTTTQILARAPSDLAQYAPITTGVPAILLDNSGVNDVTFTADSAAVIYARRKAIWALGRELGFHVIASTYYGFPFEYQMELRRVAIHDLMLANPDDYDSIARWDLINGKHRDDFFIDTVHANTVLRRMMASSVVAGLQGHYPVLLEAFRGTINAGATGALVANASTILAMTAVSDPGGRWSGAQFATPTRSWYRVSGSVGFDGTVLATNDVYVGLYVNNSIVRASTTQKGVVYTASPGRIEFNWEVYVDSFMALDVRFFTSSASDMTVRNNVVESNLTIRQLHPSEMLT